MYGTQIYLLETRSDGERVADFLPGLAINQNLIVKLNQYVPVSTFSESIKSKVDLAGHDLLSSFQMSQVYNLGDHTEGNTVDENGVFVMSLESRRHGV